jgi:phage shock protein A
MKLRVPIALVMVIIAQTSAAVWYIAGLESNIRQHDLKFTYMQQEIDTVNSQLAAAVTASTDQAIARANAVYQIQYLRDKIKDLEDTYSNSVTHRLNLEQSMRILENKLAQIQNHSHKHTESSWISVSDYNRKDGGWTLHN